MRKKLIIVSISLIIGLFGLVTVKNIVLAEQSGSSPESGATSRIKTIYDSLVSLTHGSDSAGGWGNWGVMWNRIRSAAEWVPTGDADEANVVAGKLFYKDSRTQKTGSLILSGDAGVGDVVSGKKYYSNSLAQQTGTLALTGDATVSDVATGKLFYSNSFTRQTGTASLAPDYSKQSLATKDDYLGTYKDEESTWTEVAGSPFNGYGGLNLATGKVKQDSRTGLWWTAKSTTYPTNQFSLSADGIRPTGGNAIAFCGALNTASYGGYNNWYLPTLKELLQASIDGMYSQDSAFGQTDDYWSSTQLSENTGYAWYVTVHSGLANFANKTAQKFVRCVRRD